MSHCDSHDTQTDPSGRPLGKLAIITYRCKPAADGFTLDALALRSAVLAAQQNSVKYLWLDAWTYRKQPPWATYEHDDFVRTLVAVMLRVSHVIWLPRSREHDPGEYQTRIWCTFEATIVHLRRLPVTAAGHSLSLRQLDTAAFGKYLVCCSTSHPLGLSPAPTISCVLPSLPLHCVLSECAGLMRRQHVLQDDRVCRETTGCAALASLERLRWRRRCWEAAAVREPTTWICWDGSTWRLCSC
mmetsp:Transcript_41378/g.109213  ORF Transcript_41378/g.109213 Transcript_41378/m.109213 type:complete len:243 (+) Transcript_41378:797-1525(+)